MSENARYQAPARARTDDADIGRDLGTRGNERRGCLGAPRLDAGRARVAETRPHRVVCGPRVRSRICERQRQRDQRVHRGSGPSAHQRDIADQLLSRAFRSGDEPQHMQPVEQREHAGELILGQSGQGMLDGDVRVQIAAAAGPEAGRVVGPPERRYNCVRERPQNRAVSIGDRRLHRWSAHAAARATRFRRLAPIAWNAVMAAGRSTGNRTSRRMMIGVK